MERRGIKPSPKRGSWLAGKPPAHPKGQCHPMLLAVALTSVRNDQLAGQGQGHDGVLVDQSREAAWGERETVSTEPAPSG